MLQCGQQLSSSRYKRPPDGDSSNETELFPENDDIIAIHNERLKLLKPTYREAGDYVCKALNRSSENSVPEKNEFAVIKVRAQPYIEDFRVQLSHTGKSTILIEGERLELLCKVPEQFGPVNVSWHRSQTVEDDSVMVELETNVPKISSNNKASTEYVFTTNNGPQVYHNLGDHSILIEEIDSRTKRLVIGSVQQDHRGYYTCLADNGVTERSRKVVNLRVKDKLSALWPFLGIVAEIFILLTIIQVWETQRAYRDAHNPDSTGPKTTASKRLPGGASVPFETIPLTSGHSSIR